MSWMSRWGPSLRHCTMRGLGSGPRSPWTRCLMIDIDERLHEFGFALRDGDPAPQPELTRRSHKVRRRRWMRRGLSAGVVALVAVVIVATLQDGPTRERVRTTPARTGSASTVLGVDAG